jgi:hypothetical protein
LPANSAPSAVREELSGHSRELLEQAYAGIDPAEIEKAIEIPARARRNLGAGEGSPPE